MLRQLPPLALGPLAWRGLLVLVLGAAAFAQLLLPRSLPVAAPAPPLPSASPGPGRAAPSQTVYAAIAEHPLFDPTRHPYVAAKPAPAAASPLAGLRDYALLGIVIGNGIRIAVLKPPAGGRTLFAAEGQAVGGWTLQRITPVLVRFANGAAHYDMRFAGPRRLDH